MMRRLGVTLALVIAAVIALAWLLRDRLMPGGLQESESAASPAGTPAGVPANALFTLRAIGDPPRGEERPQIAHVAIVDLDRDGINDVLGL